MGLPAKGNIDVQNKPVPKEESRNYSVFVKNNATLGTYPLI
jgi:hypothetical protein